MIVTLLYSAIIPKLSQLKLTMHACIQLSFPFPTSMQLTLLSMHSKLNIHSMERQREGDVFLVET